MFIKKEYETNLDLGNSDKTLVQIVASFSPEGQAVTLHYVYNLIEAKYVDIDKWDNERLRKLEQIVIDDLSNQEP